MDMLTTFMIAIAVLALLFSIVLGVPLGVISAESKALMSMVNTMRRTRLPPACCTSSWPAQVVSPAAS